MPRHQWDDGDDDYGERPHPRRPGMSPAVIVLVVLGGVCLLGLVACAGIAFLGRMAGPGAQAPPAAVVVQAEPVKGAKGTTRVYSRQEFLDLVRGKTPREVRTLLGPPKKESESPKRVVWYYQERTTDPATTELDREAQVVFENDRVVRVDY